MSISAFPSTDVNARILSAYRPARQSQFPVVPFRSRGWRWGVMAGRGWGRGGGGHSSGKGRARQAPLILAGLPAKNRSF